MVLPNDFDILWAELDQLQRNHPTYIILNPEREQAELMKAYRVEFKDAEWCDVVHANDEKDARKLFYRSYGGDGEYIDTRAYRIPEMDLLPLTGKNLVDYAGFDDDDWLDGRSWICKCYICATVLK